MLLTPPRLVDLCLGIAFIIINTCLFACSYCFIVQQRAQNNPLIQRVYLSTVCYGYVQSILGFIAGLWLARITQVRVSSHEEPVASEEEMQLMMTLGEDESSSKA
jgi:hypothetical protein